MSSSDKEKAREQLVKRSDEMKAAIEDKEAQIQFIEQQMADITKYVQNMVVLFNKSHFYDLQSVSSHQDYDGVVVFNENNVTTYLSELEEYVSNLITFLSWKSHDRFFQFASLSLDNALLLPKDFREEKDKLVMEQDKIPTMDKFPLMEEETEIGDDLITTVQDRIRQCELIL